MHHSFLIHKAAWVSYPGPLPCDNRNLHSHASEHWNTIVVIISHIHHILTVNADTDRPAQFSIGTALLLKLPREIVPSLWTLEYHCWYSWAITCNIPVWLSCSLSSPSLMKLLQVRRSSKSECSEYVLHTHAFWWMVMPRKLLRLLTFLSHCSDWG